MADIEWIKEKTTPIAVRYGLNRMYLFGSHAKGTATKKSDIDLLFEKGDRLSLLGVSSMLQDLQESLECSVDLVSRDSLEPGFRDEVLSSEVLLYERLTFFNKSSEETIDMAKKTNYLSNREGCCRIHATTFSNFLM